MPIPVCPNPETISTGASGEALCSGAWVEVASAADFSGNDLDPVQMGEAFSSGFLVIATFWVVAKGASVVIDFIAGRKL